MLSLLNKNSAEHNSPAFVCHNLIKNQLTKIGSCTAVPCSYPGIQRTHAVTPGYSGPMFRGRYEAGGEGAARRGGNRIKGEMGGGGNKG